MVHKRPMTKLNWYAAGAGLILILLGFVLVAPIQRDYETPRAFFAILTLNLGILTVILGLALPFEKIADYLSARIGRNNA